jgi:hypothetical protein
MGYVVDNIHLETSVNRKYSGPLVFQYKQVPFQIIFLCIPDPEVAPSED